MFRRHLTLLLIALLTSQSVWAMADSHRFHQDGTIHISFEHSLDFSQNQIDLTDNTATVSDHRNHPDQDDCHCCHCHSAPINYIGVEYSIPLFVAHHLQQSNLLIHFFSALSTHLLRPPIV